MDLNQIIDKRYYEKYLKYDLTLLGVVCADKEVKCEFREISGLDDQGDLMDELF